MFLRRHRVLRLSFQFRLWRSGCLLRCLLRLFTVQRQQRQVAEFEKLERRKLPPDMDYDHIQGLRLEAREKLSALRPLNVGQAGRVSGVSPADVAALLIWLQTHDKEADA